MKKILSRLKSDKADSIVSAVIVFPMMVMLIITGIDYSVYMSDRGQVQGIARDAARTVAIMGGNGSSGEATPLQKAYGQTRAQACGAVDPDGIANKALTSNSTAVECNIINTLNSQAGLTNVDITKVACTPSKAEEIGTRVSCTITWKYNGIPGSVFSFIASDSENDTIGTSESEVNLSGINLVAW